MNFIGTGLYDGIVTPLVPTSFPTFVSDLSRYTDVVFTKQASSRPNQERKQENATMSDSIFDGIEDASVTGGGGWIKPGRYQAEIVAVKRVKKYDGTLFVNTDLTITKVIDDVNGESNRLGEEVTYFLRKTGNDMFLPNFKQFITACLNVTGEEITVAEATKITADEQPMAGMIVEFYAKDVGTKAGGTYTKVTFVGEVKQESDTEAA